MFLGSGVSFWRNGVVERAECYVNILISSPCGKQYVLMSFGPFPSGSVGIFLSIHFHRLQRNHLPATSFPNGRIGRETLVVPGTSLAHVLGSFHT